MIELASPKPTNHTTKLADDRESKGTRRTLRKSRIFQITKRPPVPTISNVSTAEEGDPLWIFPTSTGSACLHLNGKKTGSAGHIRCENQILCLTKGCAGKASAIRLQIAQISALATLSRVLRIQCHSLYPIFPGIKDKLRCTSFGKGVISEFTNERPNKKMAAKGKRNMTPPLKSRIPATTVTANALKTALRKLESNVMTKALMGADKPS